MASRPLVTVQSPKSKQASTVTLPYVFVSPIRSDIVNYVHTLMNKNARQPYAVKRTAGHEYSAESWGTGRAVARIPRISGSGTHRSGQGAFGNMCRGGRMFAPTKTHRKWHKKISKNQRRYATVSALAATAVPALVQARGHRIEKIAEVPLVVKDADLATVAKTKDAVALLAQLNAGDDLERVKASRGIRRGKGKARNRRYVQRRGPLVVYAGKASDAQVRAFRNIPGVDLVNVTRLNLLQLAPGGHLGRFVIWQESAFKALDGIFGTRATASTQKRGYRPPRALLSNADLQRIINSAEVQSVLRDKKPKRVFNVHRKNPLRNFGALVKLNPYALTQRRRALLQAAKGKTARKTTFKANRTAFTAVFNTPSVAPERSADEMPTRY
jgi:large subunit ribosomal protein L4e